ncbi:signal peptidase I [Parasulfitobacter algicola]|uniref:Signal peptidase I n=1 Tax=Parasulfitobacter algicola TaxID=2614809 RepID=A0ABX2IV63_9RHOB|nr:signal peptidase I [Sulfitobacter algicola]NSX53933.1 signal peptidase I [Sulfitobacter algicola]
MADKAAKKDGFNETLKTVFYALLIAGIFRSFFFQPFWIPSGSMKDTLLIGDFLFVNKMAYGYSKYSCPFAACPISGRLFGSEPERGDIVVFRHPVTNQDYIKRLVGLPGDRVQMVQGFLHLNGQPVPTTQVEDFEETYELQGTTMVIPRTIQMVMRGVRTGDFTFPRDPRNTPSCSNGNPGQGAICEKERFTEVLPNGVSHSILNIGPKIQDNTPVYIVPQGHYFFMGDNRDNSVDSRVAQNSFPQPGVGFVSEEFLVGRADRVIFSAEGASILFFWTWRSDRFFKRLD